MHCTFDAEGSYYGEDRKIVTEGIMKHGSGSPFRRVGLEYSDAAKRCSDIVTMHIVAGQSGRWCAIRLSDGGSDGVTYDTRADAIRHQLHETQCAYVQIPRDSMPPEHAERFLAFHRKCYDAGFRLSDPDDRREPIMPYTIEGFRAFMKGST